MRLERWLRCYRSALSHRRTAARFAEGLRLSAPGPDAWLAWAYWAQATGLEEAKLCNARQAPGCDRPAGPVRAVNVDANREAWAAVVQFLADASGLPVATLEGLGLYVGVQRRADNDAMKAQYEDLRRRLAGRESEASAGIADALRADGCAALVAQHALAAWDARASALRAGSEITAPDKGAVPPDVLQSMLEAAERRGATRAANKRRRRADSQLADGPKPLTPTQRHTHGVVTKHHGNVAAAARELGKHPATVRESYLAAVRKLKSPGGKSRQGVRKAQSLPQGKRGEDLVADGSDRRRSGRSDG